MLRISSLLVWLVGLLTAAGAQAASFFIYAPAPPDFGNPPPGPGEIITITVVVEVGAETLDPFHSYGLQVGWDDSIATGPSNSAQNPVLAGLQGSPTPTCAVSGDVCTIITQVNTTLSPVNVGPATIVGTLDLEITNVGVLGLFIASYSNNGSTDPSEVTWVIPEPGTAALLALGLAGLGLARRRSST